MVAPMCDFNCRQTTWSQLTSHLYIPDFLGEVGLNFALNLVTSCCGCKTAGARVNELWWPKALGWDFQNDTIVSFKINTFFSNPSFTCRRLDQLSVCDVIQNVIFIGDEIDHCSFYDSEESGQCHHNTFTAMPTLESLYGSGIKMCCNGHAYKFWDNCEVSP